MSPFAIRASISARERSSVSDIPDPDEWIGDDPTTFYHALGRLIHAFAAAESELSLEVTNYVTAPAVSALAERDDERPIARLHAAVRVVAQGGRYADRKDAIKKLVRADRADSVIIDALDYAFQQFGEIQRLRDELAHHPALNAAPGVWRVTTFSSAREIDAVKTRGFTPDALHNAANDLSRISRLLKELLGAAMNGQTAGEGLQVLRQSWFAPWQYKPSEQAPHYPPPRASPQ